MAASHSSIFEVVATFVSSFGLMINAILSVIIILDWKDSRKMKPYERLMLSLGLSRVFLLLCFFIRIINRMSELNAYPSDTARWVFRMAQLTFDFSSLWFTMWLCVLYYVKIGIFKNTLLIRFKLSIPQLIWPMILTSSVISFSFGFIFAFNVRETWDIMDNVYGPTNESFVEDLEFVLPSYFFGHFVPFIVASVSNFFLIETISVHILRIMKNMTGFTAPSIDAHISAIRSVCLLQFMNICNLICTVLFRFCLCDGVCKSISFLIFNFYPTLHSVAFIISNAKLKRVLWRIVDCVQGCCTIKTPASIHHLESKAETVVQQE